MPDPCLECFFAEAQSRGLRPDWHESQDRTELLVNPVLLPLDPAHPIRDDLGGHLCIGFGVAVGGAITCWVREGFSGTGRFLCPWSEGEADTLLLDQLPSDMELTRFPTVTTFDEGLALFDAAVARYMAEMRQFCLETPEYRDQVNDWASPAPLAAGH